MPFLSRVSLTDLLKKVEQASKPAQLMRAVNQVQVRLWKLDASKQGEKRAYLVDALIEHVLHSSSPALRLEAASNLRAFVQSALVAEPQKILVTLVTAATRASQSRTEESIDEQQAYLKMIFDCFWPFRYPYASYTWEFFPPNELFYPLAPLMGQHNPAIQAELLGIFAELPTLDDPEIAQHVLPVALAWSADADAERRRQTTYIFALINENSAREALQRLMMDADDVVRACAKRACESIRKA